VGAIDSHLGPRFGPPKNETTMFAIRCTALALVLAAGTCTTATAQAPREKATRQLDQRARAERILSFLHFGSTYSDHKQTGRGKVMTRDNRERVGHFYLEYKFDWKVGRDTGSTTASFFFDEKGILYDVMIDKTTAEFNQPFLLANLSIKILGETVYALLKDDLSTADRRVIRELIDEADAKGLLKFTLALDLATSR
jgi:hypothetical protein